MEQVQVAIEVMGERNHSHCMNRHRHSFLNELKRAIYLCTMSLFYYTDTKCVPQIVIVVTNLEVDQVAIYLWFSMKPSLL